MKFKLLNQKHISYNEEQLTKTHLLYKGGRDLKANAHLFIPEFIHESSQTYNARLKQASYINYMAAIIDFFTAKLFSKQIQVTSEESKIPDFYSFFLLNCDNSSQSLQSFLKEAFKNSLIYSKAFIGIDFPTSYFAPKSLKEQEDLNLLNAYVYHIDNFSVINWKCNNNFFDWIVLKKETYEQNSFDQTPSKQIQFKIWEKTKKGAKYSIYQLIKENKEEIKDSDEFTLIESKQTSFKEIPIFTLELKSSLAIGEKIETLVEEHYKMRSNLLFAESRSLSAIPIFKQGPEFSSDESFSSTSEDPSRGYKAAQKMQSRGMIVIGHEDEISFAEPTGAAYQLISDQLKEHVDEIYRVVSNMAHSVASTAQNQAKSALSKQEDNSSLEIILNDYGDLIQKFTAQILQFIASSRKESIDWKIFGLENFDLTDKAQSLQDLQVLSSQILSPLFQKLIQMRTINLVIPNADHKDLQIIEQEISQNLIKKQQQEQEIHNSLISPQILNK